MIQNTIIRRLTFVALLLSLFATLAQAQDKKDMFKKFSDGSFKVEIVDVENQDFEKKDYELGKYISSSTIHCATSFTRFSQAGSIV